MALNQFLSGGKKPSGGSSNNSGLVGMATSFLSSGGSSSASKPASSPAAGIVGALAGQFLGGGKKTEKPPQNQNYSGASPTQGQGHGGGFMDSVTGMFGGGHSQPQSQVR